MLLITLYLVVVNKSYNIQRLLKVVDFVVVLVLLIVIVVVVALLVVTDHIIFSCGQ